MKSLGLPLIQHDWCPYKKGKLGPRDEHIKRRQCEETERRWLSMSQGAKPGRDTTM